MKLTVSRPGTGVGVTGGGGAAESLMYTRLSKLVFHPFELPTVTVVHAPCQVVGIVRS